MNEDFRTLLTDLDMTSVGEAPVAHIVSGGRTAMRRRRIATVGAIAATVFTIGGGAALGTQGLPDNTGDEAGPAESPATVDDTPQEASPTIGDPKRTAGIGDLVSVGSWDVEVTDIELDGDDIIEMADRSNGRAQGQYVVLNYEAVYTGPEESGDTTTDLSWSFTTTDLQMHDEANAETPAESQSWPTDAKPGETVQGQAVFDLDPTLVEGGTLIAQTSAGAHSYWTPWG